MTGDWRLALTHRDDSPDGGLAALVARVNASGFVDGDIKAPEAAIVFDEPDTDYLALHVER